MKQKRKYIQSTKRTICAHADLFNTAFELFLRGKENKRGSIHLFRASNVFTAFALEAFLNHAGEEVFSKKWTELERSTPLGKLIILCEKLDIKIDWGESPWSTAKTIFKMRNACAHGRDQTKKERKIITTIDKWYLLEGQWEKLSTEGNVERIQKDITKIMEMIWKKLGKNEGILFDIGPQVTWRGEI
ncbi:hypothetical protein KKG41_06070 [Patescibacteria group bacterium]|nr:hypothetical protein [Patescibacteria group bacterium]MBU1890011.1 hypothetical protein [Patescibacteria group bacterium]